MRNPTPIQYELRQQNAKMMTDEWIDISLEHRHTCNRVNCRIFGPHFIALLITIITYDESQR